MFRRFFRRLIFLATFLPTLAVLILVLTADTYVPRSVTDKVRQITAPYEFEFVSWTVNALWAKALQFTQGDERYLSTAAWHDLVLEYNRLMDGISADEAELTRIFADPGIADPMRESEAVRAALAEKRRQQSGQQSLVEAILQEQVSSELRREGFALGGEIMPPLLFRFSPIPMGLIISPREVIRQDANILLLPGLPLERQIELEQEAERTLGVSALSVPFGGLGTFPTMIMEISWLNWVVEAVTHEWAHIYLFFTPLGIGYESVPELRTINETAANLMGKTIGARIIRSFYPELAGLLPPSDAESGGSAAGLAAPKPDFDYAREMHITRVEADRLLAEGKIEAAEAYMEQRRVFIMEHFAEHGRVIRRLNQAFFAFYGSYADSPGERGEDPVGPAVIALFELCPSPGAFLRAVSRVSSFVQLQQIVASGNCG